jgi:hypothetical protein
MWLAQSEPDVSRLEGLSLRQAYFRLGLATEHKSPAKFGLPLQLPSHIRLAGKLFDALKPCADVRRMTPEQREAYRQDLRSLYNRLRPLFETDTAGAMAARLTAGH